MLRKLISTVCFIAAVLFSFTSELSAEAPIAEKHRIANYSDKGVCWFACVESIANTKDCKRIAGLTDAVVETGIGDQGATMESREFWRLSRSFTITSRDNLSLNDLRKFSDAGIHGIAVLNPWTIVNGKPTCHAVVITDVSKDRETHKDGRGKRHDNYWITFFDPNDTSSLYRLPWNQFSPSLRRVDFISFGN